MHNLNKTVLSLSIYTAFLAYALSNDWLYIPAGCMFVASILSEIGGRLLDNRKLPIRTLVEIEEKKAEVEEEEKVQVKTFKIQKDDSEFNEQKKALVKKAMDNGYKLIREEFIPEELKQ